MVHWVLYHIYIIYIYIDTGNTAPELIQGPGVLPNRGDKSIYKRDKKNWAVGSRVKGGHLNSHTQPHAASSSSVKD